ncbi:hypothetical protein [Halosimplex marinum]|uniref:hypothetical protein n=1 Tax=Halosimplex marinum TaxID=3396620 RepID=UPI003F56B766
MERGTSYFGVRDRNHVERDLDRFVDEGLNAVLHTFSERDQRYYEGTMADVVDASHERDLTVYVNPWGVGRVFGGEALSEFIGRNPGARQELSTGDAVPAACFNHPEFRAFMREWTRDAAGLGADVLFWDEPHWYITGWYDEDYPDDAWGCRCEHCRERFADRHGEPMPEEHTEAVAAFREESLLDFLREMMAVAGEEGAENAVCLLPSEDADHGLRDWSDLAASDDLDVLATDPYWGAFEEGSVESFVGSFSETVADLADDHGIRSQIWIQGFRLDGDPERVEEVRTATRTACDSGVDSVFMWGYDACRSISSIACENPDAVWEAYLDELP